jgi:hypothetical protein
METTETMSCGACGATGVPMKTCVCNEVCYCSNSCQRAHRGAHNARCEERRILDEALSILHGLVVQRKATYDDNDMHEAQVAVGLVYPFLRKSETHRSALFSANITLDKKMLGLRGTALDLLCALLTLAGKGPASPTFVDDIIFTLDLLSRDHNDKIWSALRRGSYAGALAVLAAARPQEKETPDLGSRRLTAGTTPSISLKYAGLGDFDNPQERATALLHRISAQKLYAREFVTAKELAMLDSGSPLLAVLKPPGGGGGGGGGGKIGAVATIRAQEMALEMLVRMLGAAPLAATRKIQSSEPWLKGLVDLLVLARRRDGGRTAAPALPKSAPNVVGAAGNGSRRFSRASSGKWDWGLGFKV